MKIKSTILKIIAWAAGFYLVAALFRGLLGRDIRWIELIFQSLLTGIIVYGLEWVYKKKTENNK